MIRKLNEFFRNIPFVLVYILYPSINIFCRLANIKLINNWIDLFWVLLLILSIPVILLQRNYFINRKRFLIVLFIFFVIFVHLTINFNTNIIEMVPLLMELKPFFYLFFVLVWFKLWGVPGKSKFFNWGAWLASILITDFIIESITIHRIARIMGSGEINYDAFLLVISTCFFIADKKLLLKNEYWKIFLIFLGLLVSLSRTGLVIEIILIFIFWQSKLFFKLQITAAALTAIIISFIIRRLSFSFLSVDRYWMWLSAIKLFLNHPLQFLLGFGIQSLPIDIPPQLSYLWKELQQTGWGLSGIYAYNLHSFWLRFITSWGMVAALPVILFLGHILINRKYTRLLRMLSLVFILEGFTMGVIYLGNVAIPFLLIFEMEMINYRSNQINNGKVISVSNP